MKRLHIGLLLLACLAAFGTHALPAAAGKRATSAPLVVPGKSIGPLKLGMTRKQASKLGLNVQPHPSGTLGDEVRLVGPYYVVFDETDRIAAITVTLSDMSRGLRVGKKTIPRQATIEQAAAFFDQCEPMDIDEGGNSNICADGHVILMQGSASMDMIQIRVLNTRLKR